jgi:asparagine synthase (glutamine-hydrolysing)
VSAIAGVVHFDGQPCDPAVLAKMAGRLRRRVPEGTSRWIDGCAGLVDGIVDSSSRRAITFDGRLDNRHDLLRQLELTTADGAAIGDAALMLRLYDAFGEGCVDRVLGDFAFAIWDGPRRRLFCARDAMGIKPFFYRVADQSIAWASGAGVLAACAGPMPAPNEGMAAEYLAGRITCKSETLFQNIFRLPPAHVLIAEAQATSARRYWSPDPQAEIRHATDDEYAAHLSALVHEAVAARLRTNRTVGIMLSGGIDSSAVTGVATQLWRAGAVPCGGIETFSISVPGKNDEAPFFTQVSDRWNLPAHRFTAQPVDGLFRDAISEELDVETYANSPSLHPLYARARERGVGLLLTGVGADEWLGTSCSAYADLVKHARIVALARRLQLDAGLTDFAGWRGAAKAAIWPVLPAPIQHVVRRAVRRGQAPAWIDPDFAARIDLAGRLRRHDDGMRFPTFEQTDTWHEGTSGLAVHSLELFARSTAAFGIELAHPFLDRRIVEFGLALPADQRWRNGRAKDLLRRAMAPHVPATIADRLDSPSASSAFVDAIATEGGTSPFDHLIAEQLGWVRGPYVRDLHERMMRQYRAGDEGYSRGAWTLWIILAMEIWLEIVTGAPAPVRAVESQTVV